MRFILFFMLLGTLTARADYLTSFRHLNHQSDFTFHDYIDSGRYTATLNFMRSPGSVELDVLRQELPHLACELNRTHDVDDLDNLRWAVYFKKLNTMTMNIHVNNSLISSVQVFYFCNEEEKKKL